MSTAAPAGDDLRRLVAETKEALQSGQVRLRAAY
jgi:hypothetical protein